MMGRCRGENLDTAFTITEQVKTLISVTWRCRPSGGAKTPDKKYADSKQKAPEIPGA